MWLYFCTTALHCNKFFIFFFLLFLATVVVISSSRQIIRVRFIFQEVPGFPLGPGVPGKPFFPSAPGRPSFPGKPCVHRAVIRAVVKLLQHGKMCKAFPLHIFSVLLQYELLRWPFIIIIRHLVFLSLLDPPLSLKHLETEINTVRERCGSAILGWEMCESKEAITRCTRNADHSLFPCDTWVSSLPFFTWSSRLTYRPWHKYSYFQLMFNVLQHFLCVHQRSECFSITKVQLFPKPMLLVKIDKKWRAQYSHMLFKSKHTHTHNSYRYTQIH